MALCVGLYYMFMWVHVHVCKCSCSFVCTDFVCMCVCVMYVYMCMQAYAPVYECRPEEDGRHPILSFSTHLRQGFSLNLVLSWWPTSPKGSSCLSPTLHSLRVTGVGATARFWCGCSLYPHSHYLTSLHILLRQGLSLNLNISSRWTGQ